MINKLKRKSKKRNSNMWYDNKDRFVPIDMPYKIYSYPKRKRGKR